MAIRRPSAFNNLFQPIRLALIFFIYINLSFVSKVELWQLHQPQGVLEFGEYIIVVDKLDALTVNTGGRHLDVLEDALCFEVHDGVIVHELEAEEE